MAEHYQFLTYYQVKLINKKLYKDKIFFFLNINNEVYGIYRCYGIKVKLDKCVLDVQTRSVSLLHDLFSSKYSDSETVLNGLPKIHVLKCLHKG